MIRHYRVTLHQGVITHGVMASSRSQAIYRTYQALGYQNEGWTLLDFSKRAVDTCTLLKQAIT